MVAGAPACTTGRMERRPAVSCGAVNDPLAELSALVSTLRKECPWDREQTPETLKTYLLEESYEVLAALDAGDPAALKDELGDLLFQIFFLSEIARERGWFDVGQVATQIAAKMRERHPHVFAGARADTAAQVRQGWEARKRRAANETGGDPLGSVPRALPALAAAFRQTERAADLGFDWNRDSDVADKVAEELEEWREAERARDQEGERKEIGDLLLAVVNLARRRGINPEEALRETNARFRARFAGVSRRAAASGREMTEIGIEELDRYWEEAKAEEK
jgi:tetrapyrrole methylase family protein/MazG family protein